MTRITSDASDVKWKNDDRKEGEQKREIERGDEEGGRCGKSDVDTEEEHHEHRETTVTKRTKISFNKKLLFIPYNFCFKE